MAARHDWYHSIFFGIYPPEEQAFQAHRLSLDMARRENLSGPMMPARRLHLTLLGLGGYPSFPRDQVEFAIELASQLRRPAFRIAFNQVVSWNGRMRPLVLSGDEGLIGAQLLSEGLRDVFGLAGVSLGGPGWINPHMTLLRDRLDLERRYVPPLTWTVDEFVLIDSLHGLGRHEVLGRWRLFA